MPILLLLMPLLVHTHLNYSVSYCSVYNISDRRMDGCGKLLIEFRDQKLINRLHSVRVEVVYLSVAYRGEFWGVQTPSEIPKALQNRAKFNTIGKLLNIAEFRTPTPQDVREKGSKILKLTRFAIVLH